MAGAQFPVTPFVEVVGSAAKVSPSQIGFTASKSGTIDPVPTVTFKVKVVAHNPAAGVNM